MAQQNTALWLARRAQEKAPAAPPPVAQGQKEVKVFKRYAVWGWLCCPYCHRRIFPLEPATRIECLQVKCRACHEVFYARVCAVPPGEEKTVPGIL